MRTKRGWLFFLLQYNLIFSASSEFFFSVHCFSFAWQLRTILPEQRDKGSPCLWFCSLFSLFIASQMMSVIGARETWLPKLFSRLKSGRDLTKSSEHKSDVTWKFLKSLVDDLVSGKLRGAWFLVLVLLHNCWLNGPRTLEWAPIYHVYVDMTLGSPESIHLHSLNTFYFKSETSDNGCQIQTSKQRVKKFPWQPLKDWSFKH